MRLTSRLLQLCLFFGLAALNLEAYEDFLFDPLPLKDMLSSGADLFLPQSMGTASETLLLGAGSEKGEELVYFHYNRGILILEEDGSPSEKTLIRFFLDSLGEEVLLPRSDNPRGSEISRPYGGGTLYFSRLNPQEIRLISDRKEIIVLEDSPGIYTSHFETGDEYFWLGDGIRYICYTGNGYILSDYDLNSISLSGKQRALFAAVFKSGRLCLVLDGGAILMVGPEESDLVYAGSMDLSNLFVDFYNHSIEYLERLRPDLVGEYEKWSARTVNSLYIKDPLNSKLSNLNRLLN